MRGGGDGDDMTGGRGVQMSRGNGEYTRLRQVGLVAIGVALVDKDAMTLVI